MADATWWYEWKGQQAGPVSQEALIELVRSSQLEPTARVWRAGMPGWQPLRELPELAAAIPAVPPPGVPTLPPPGAAAPPPFSAEATSAPPAAPLEPVGAGVTLVLSIVTLGIYAAVKFYQAGTAYEALAGRRTRFVTYFWLSIALGVAAWPFHLLGPVGPIAAVASLVFTILTLFEALAVREEAMRRAGVAPPLSSDGTLKGLFIAGLLTSWLLVGLVLLCIVCFKLFADHDAIVAAVRARGAAGPGAPPSGPPVVAGPPPAGSTG